jgi:hypothetical protein
MLEKIQQVLVQHHGKILGKKRIENILEQIENIILNRETEKKESNDAKAKMVTTKLGNRAIIMEPEVETEIKKPQSDGDEKAVVSYPLIGEDQPLVIKIE